MKDIEKDLAGKLEENPGTTASRREETALQGGRSEQLC